MTTAALPQLTERALLLPEHQAILEASAIAAEVWQARGSRSATDPMELHRLGFAGYQCLPGLLLPIWTTAGTQEGYYLRPDEPRTGRNGKLIKYEFMAGARMHLDVHPFVRPYLPDPNVPIAVTEGTRKADCAISHELPCISIGGVWSWRGKNELGGLTALGDWDDIHLRERTVFLIFDSDVLQKRGVNQALSRLKAFLESRHANVRICYLPASPDADAHG